MTEVNPLDQSRDLESPLDAREFDALLDYLKRTRGFDFTAYKRPSLIRRIRKRMDSIGVHDFASYIDELEVHPEEFVQLFNVVLINVTAFFRDDLVWKYLRDEIVSKLAARDGPLRIWSAGCASGEEAYSVAMLLAEALGRDQFRERVKIYATDVDDQALAQARAASYTERQVASIPKEFLDNYFAAEMDRFVFDKDLRRSVIFGRHDLIQDAPISRVNLLLCRNALMYFNAEAQGRILARFHFALAPDGVLFLGKAEMLLSHSHLFAPIELRQRIFSKLSKDTWRERMAIMTQANGDQDFDTPASSLYPAALDAAPTAQFVVDADGQLALFNEQARTLLNLVPADIGRPIQDLDVSYRPIELRSLLTKISDHRRSILVRDVQWDPSGREPRSFDIHLAPLNGHNNRHTGVSVSFIDISRIQELQAQLNRSKQELETAYEELQSTNEELETTNEELQSTVEELETTNEELQSTNEELETMNEELQSTNEELQTVNEELRERGEDLNRANSFFESILAGVRSGVVVIDLELHVLAWNHRAADLWGLRPDEARGQNFLNLDIGLPVDRLRGAIRACIGGESDVAETLLPATNRRGRALTCKVTISPLIAGEKHIRGAILLMEEQNHQAS